MLKIHLITPALPPHFDGIGDYTSCLAAELRRSANVTIFAGTPGSSSIEGVKIEHPFVATDPSTSWHLVDALHRDRPDWVVLEYNPFSYGKWGLNLALPEVIREIRRAGTRVAIMVHEPFVPFTSPQFAVMASWQRYQLWGLGRVADVLFFSITPWAVQFAKWFPRTPIHHLPVGSNIPRITIDRSEARSRLGIRSNDFVLSVFGNLSGARTLDQLRSTIVTVRQKTHDFVVLYVGPHGSLMKDAAGSVRAITDGPLPADEVSRRLRAADVGLSTFIDGVSTRRGSLMAALQHGIASVGTRGYLTDEMLLREDGRSLLLANVGDSTTLHAHVLRLLRDPALRRQIGDAGQQLYNREFAWEPIASRMLAALR